MKILKRIRISKNAPDAGLQNLTGLIFLIEAMVILAGVVYGLLHFHS